MTTTTSSLSPRTRHALAPAPADEPSAAATDVLVAPVVLTTTATSLLLPFVWARITLSPPSNSPGTTANATKGAIAMPASKVARGEAKAEEGRSPPR